MPTNESGASIVLSIDQMPRGVDVASYQRQPDWTAAAASGLAFAITKATEGVSYVNPTLAHNWPGIKAAGLVRGAYHFGRPSENGPVEEADHFLAAIDTAGGLEVGDLLALDLEDVDVGASVNLSAWVLGWLAYVESRVGVKPLVYTGTWYSGPHGLADEPKLADYGLWLAAYQGVMPTPPAPWQVVAFWQYTDSASVPGIVGAVDGDRFNGELAALRAYGKPEPVAPAIPDDDAAALRSRVDELEAERASLISQLGYARGDVADAIQAAVNTLRSIGA